MDEFQKDLYKRKLDDLMGNLKGIVVEELEDLNGTIENEKLWEKGYTGEGPNPHTWNLEYLRKYKDTVVLVAKFLESVK